jgi:dolichyl-phosphate-mannose--protein O-mannosyl transferase
MPGSTLWGWLGPLLVTAFGTFLRFDRLVVPRTLAFDETYYAKDAWSILHYGVERNLLSIPSDPTLIKMIQAGNTHIFASCSGVGCGEYVAQPPAGKLLIAVGEAMFGLTPFGWRFSAAVFGSVAILLMCRIARRMTRSTLLGCIAGLLISLDGLEFVLSRTGILDIFLMFFVLASFGCLVIDRDVSRARLADAVARGSGDDAGPRLGIRKWRLAAGVCIGIACACKWDAIWYLLAFAALSIAWDIGARRAAGIPSFRYGALIRDAKWLPVTLGVVPLAVYLASWTGWLVTRDGYDRNYAQLHGVHTPVISALYSLYEYHVSMLRFGVTLHKTHPYMSQPWDWLVITRPVAFYYQCYTNTAYHACPKHYSGPEWSQEVLAIGTPLIWWAAVPALIFCLAWWLLHRDWRAGAVVLGVCAGWLTWFPFVSRTKFYYYALEFEPFLILSIVLCLGLIIGPVRAGRLRRSAGATAVGVYLIAVLLNFAYLYPVLAGKVIPYASWLARMWYRRGWI